MTAVEGAARRQRAQGARHEALQQSLVGIDPELATWTDGFVFDQAWVGDELAWPDRMLVAITALAVQGHHAQLRNYLHGALQDGMTADQLRAAFRMLTVYAGFPIAIQALDVLRTVLEAEARAGR